MNSVLSMLSAKQIGAALDAAGYPDATPDTATFIGERPSGFMYQCMWIDDDEVRGDVFVFIKDNQVVAEF